MSIMIFPPIFSTIPYKNKNSNSQNSIQKINKNISTNNFTQTTQTMNNQSSGELGLNKKLNSSNNDFFGIPVDNATVTYNTTALDKLLALVANGTIDQNEFFILIRHITVEKTAIFVNGTHTYINRTIYYMSSPSVNLTDAISQNINPRFIMNFNIQNIISVDKFNYKSCALSLALSLQNLITNHIISLNNFDTKNYSSCFQDLFQTIPNLELVQLEYMTTGGFNHNIPVTSFAIFDSVNNSILYDSLVTNMIAAPKITQESLLTTYSNCISNQVTQTLTATATYAASCCGFNFNFVTYKVSYFTTFTVSPQGFLNSGNDIINGNSFEGSLSGTATPTITAIDNTGALVGISFIPIVGPIVVSWYDGILTTLVSTDLNSYYYIRDYNNGPSSDYTNLDDKITNSFSPTSPSSQAYSENFIVYRGNSDNQPSVSSVYEYGSVNIWLGGSLSLSNYQYSGTHMIGVSYARNSGDPHIVSATLTTTNMLVNHKENLVIQLNSPINNPNFIYKNVYVKVSVPYETNASCIQFGDSSSYTYVIPTLYYGHSNTNTISVSPSAIGNATIRVSVTSYQLCINGSTEQPTLTASSPSDYLDQNVYVLSSIADPEIITVYTDNKAYEPNQPISITADIRNYGGCGTKTLSLDVYAKSKSADNTEYKEIASYLIPVNENLSPEYGTNDELLVSCNISIKTNNIYDLKIGVSYTFISNSHTYSQTSASTTAMLLNNNPITIGLPSLPSISIGYVQDTAGKQGTGTLSFNLDNPSKYTPLTIKVQTTETEVDRIFESLTYDKFISALMTLGFSPLIKYINTMNPAVGIAKPSWYSTLGYNRLKSMIKSANEAYVLENSPKPWTAFFIDLGLKLGFSVATYLTFMLVKFSWNSALNNVLSEKSAQVSPENNLNNNLIAELFQFNDPAYSGNNWIDYNLIGYSQINLTLNVNFVITDSYGNTYQYSIYKPESTGIWIPDDNGVLDLSNVQITIEQSTFKKADYSIYFSTLMSTMIDAATAIAEGTLIFFFPALSYSLSPYAIMNGIAAGIYGVICAIADKLGRDDPDTNFKEVATPTPYQLNYTISTNSSNEAIMNDETNILTQVYGYINASSVTCPRMQAALDNESYYYTKLQANTLINYTTQCDNLLFNYLNDYLAENSQNVTINTTTAFQISNELQNVGIPPEMKQKTNSFNDSLGIPNSEFNLSDFITYGGISQMNESTILELINSTQNQTNIINEITQWRVNNNQWRDLAFTALSQIQNEETNQSIQSISDTILNEMSELNNSLFIALQENNYVQASNLMVSLNDTFWNTFLSTLNASIDVFYPSILLANYILHTESNMVVSGFPNDIVFNLSTGQTTANFSLDIYNTGSFNSTYSYYIDSIPDGFNCTLTPSSVFLIQTNVFQGNFSITVTNPALINTNLEYTLIIKVSSILNPELYKYVEYHLIFARYNFSATLNTPSVSLQPGKNGYFMYDLQNIGNVGDSYDVQLVNSTIPKEWMTYANQICAYSGSENNHSVIVQIPKSPFIVPKTYYANLIIQSQGNSSLTKSILLQLNVLPYNEFNFEINQFNSTIQPGNNETLNIYLQNLGNINETYLINVTDLNPLFHASEYYLNLSPNESCYFNYNVFIQRSYKVAPGETSFNLEVDCLHTQLKSVAVVQFNITKFVDINYNLTQINTTITTGQLTRIDVLQVHNLGNIKEQFSFTATEGINSSWIIPIQHLSLAPNIVGNVSIYANIPRVTTSAAGLYSFNIQIFMNQTNQYQYVPCNLTVLPFYQLNTSYISLSPNVIEPGNNSTSSIYIQNLGNTPITLSITSEGINLNWINFSENTFTLNAGEKTNVSVLLVPPRIFSTSPGLYNFTLQVQIVENPSYITYFNDQLTITPFYNTTFVINPTIIEAQIGTQDTYVINVTNEGNVQTAYKVESTNWNTSLVDNWTSVSPKSLLLAPGESQSINLSISVPYFWSGMNSIQATCAIVIKQLNESSYTNLTVNLKVESTPVSWIHYIINNINVMQAFINQSTTSHLKCPLLTELNSAKSLLNSSLVYFQQNKFDSSIIRDIFTQHELLFTGYMIDFTSFFHILPTSLSAYLHKEFTARQMDMATLLGLTVNVARHNDLGTTLTSINLEHIALTSYAYSNSCYYLKLFTERQLDRIAIDYSFLYFYLTIGDNNFANRIICMIEHQYQHFLMFQNRFKIFGMISGTEYSNIVAKVNIIDSGLHNFSELLE